MVTYSLRQNLRYIGLVFANPRRLIAELHGNASLTYGIVPFLLYIAACEVGWLSAYRSGAYQAINPLPKFLPIPEDQYLLYQATLGSFVKAAGVLIFLVVYLLSMIHPAVFLLAVVYMVWFVAEREHISTGRSILLVLPAMVLSGPVPGMFFR